MSRYLSTFGGERTRGERTGVLLANLGTPDAPTAAALRRYLREFLADPRVVELPRLPWWLLLNLVIVPVRAPRSARLYASVWTPDGSPLLVGSRRLASRVAGTLSERLGGVVPVELGMRYGRPAASLALRSLAAAGCDRIVVVPLFPQYSGATTGSVLDAVGDELRRWRAVPALSFVRSYHDHPAYVAALADSIRRAWAGEQPPDRLLVSFHGLPERYVRAGDPYRGECLTTARLLRDALGVPEESLVVAFQSRFGREPWLQPYTDETLVSLARSGVASVDVVCPGFAVDCLETLEEIGGLNRRGFLAAGGRRFRYIPALNDSATHAAVIAGVVEGALGVRPLQQAESAPRKRHRARLGLHPIDL